MASSPSTPDPAVPAQRPERTETVDPENIVAGDSNESTESSNKGRRALRRPTAGSSSGTGSVGTGLSV